jgi:glutathione reductase (NADPH)
MATQYDLVIVGTGVAASTAASLCRDAGWRVAVVDHRPFGGTCALRGCDPKKVLVGVADALDLARRLRGKGLSGCEPAIDWHDLRGFERSFTEPVPEERERQLAERGIDAYHGLARFRDPSTIEANGAALEGRFILIASGAKPMRLGVPGEEHLSTSTDFLRLERLPERIVLVGGGFIAAEFAHIAARAGAKPTIVEMGPRLLAPFDPDLVGWLAEKTKRLGVDIRLRTKVEGIEKAANGYRVAVSSEGARSTIDADLVVHAAGRVPDLEALDLAAGEVAQTSGRLDLDSELRSVSNPRVYAAGDAAAKGPALTPVASQEAKIVSANMLRGAGATPDYSITPSVVFTIPPLARVGLSEEEAREKKLRVRVKCEKTADWYSSRRLAEDCAGFKTLVDEDGRVVGAHVLGPGAEDVVNVFAVAMRGGLSAQTLKEASYAYPSAVSDIGYML